MAKNIKILQDLVKTQKCADCNNKEITHASYNIGIFICSTCASIHNTMGKEVSKTKSLTLDHWEDSQIQRLRNVGNNNARSEYERYVPVWWRKGKEGDPIILLREWIYSKYLHQKFKSGPPNKELEGFLKEDAVTNRRFVLAEDSLVYYIKDKEKVISLEYLDISLKKLDAKFVMQFDYLNHWSTRHIYVYHDEDEVMISWYNALRGAIYEACRKKWAMSEGMLLAQLNFSKVEGYLWKAGPSPSYAHRKRFFILQGRKLMYHHEALDSYPKGEIFLGALNNFKISPGGFGADIGRFSFSLHTPYRTFVLAAETESERDKWVVQISSVIESDMSPRDLEMSEKLVRKKTGGFLR